MCGTNGANLDRALTRQIKKAKIGIIQNVNIWLFLSYLFKHNVHWVCAATLSLDLDCKKFYLT